MRGFGSEIDPVLPAAYNVEMTYGEHLAKRIHADVGDPRREVKDERP
jgi:hypothetical protein